MICIQQVQEFFIRQTIGISDSEYYLVWDKELNQIINFLLIVDQLHPYQSYLHQPYVNQLNILKIAIDVRNLSRIDSGSVCRFFMQNMQQKQKLNNKWYL
ncbi:unnamed protein product [Paramecium pentaurelia]|uniref:Uncharacterized protein n=1 Tax=Paramecium pentaurelia TaxID=43138 RepID=A0A8S1S4P7_9CILI|nr:unnamed protein product [Paramecium pentaurelia]